MGLLHRITAEDAHRRRWQLLALTSVGAFMGPLDGSIVSVALPAMGPELDLSYAAGLWVQAAYLLATAVLTLGFFTSAHANMTPEKLDGVKVVTAEQAREVIAVIETAERSSAHGRSLPLPKEVYED